MTNYFEERAKAGFPEKPKPNPYEGIPIEVILTPEDADLAIDFLGYMRRRNFPGAEPIVSADGSFTTQGYRLGVIFDPYKQRGQWSYSNRGVNPGYQKTRYGPALNALTFPIDGPKQTYFDGSDLSYGAKGLFAYLCEDYRLRTGDGLSLAENGMGVSTVLPAEVKDSTYQDSVPGSFANAHSYSKGDVPTPTIIYRPCKVHVALPATFKEVLEFYAQTNQ